MLLEKEKENYVCSLFCAVHGSVNKADSPPPTGDRSLNFQNQSNVTLDYHLSLLYLN